MAESNGYTNREFAKDDELFKTACEVVDLKPTARQASKWRRGFGKAYRQGMKQAQRILEEKYDREKQAGVA